MSSSTHTTQGSEIDQRDLAAVPMFPLPNVVLLPGTLLPLHIFEERYRDMTRDVLEGSGLLAMARLKSGYHDDYHGRPPVFDIVGVGEVLAADKLSDGRYNILVRGLIRASIVEELPQQHAYRVIRVESLADASDDPAVVRVAHRKLVEFCDQLSVLMERGGDKLRQLVRIDATPGGCADVVAAALITEHDERQELLEMCSPLDRLAHMTQHVSRLLTSIGASREMPN